MTAIDKVIEIAEAEAGYLEKKSISNLYDKTANAGSANYTKYWAEIAPDYQGQPWCACFVTWCFVKAFGKDTTARLLKHYPYISCVRISSLFTLNANPRRGDIVIFCRNGVFAHTGIVTSVDGDYFKTVEGNTSGGTTIIANGGGVCRKGYYNSKLPGTKFITPDWNLAESEDIDMEELNRLKQEITDMKARYDGIINTMGAEIAQLKARDNKAVYNYIDENMPEWARDAVRWCVESGIISGTGSGLGLDDTGLRYVVMIYRAMKKAAKWAGVKI